MKAETFSYWLEFNTQSKGNSIVNVVGIIGSYAAPPIWAGVIFVGDLHGISDAKNEIL